LRRLSSNPSHEPCPVTSSSASSATPPSVFATPLGLPEAASTHETSPGSQPKGSLAVGPQLRGITFEVRGGAGRRFTPPLGRRHEDPLTEHVSECIRLDAWVEVGVPGGHLRRHVAAPGLEQSLVDPLAGTSTDEAMTPDVPPLTTDHLEPERARFRWSWASSSVSGPSGGSFRR
jgi:hypothetical protein